jgi:hypothetical protein
MQCALSMLSSLESRFTNVQRFHQLSLAIEAWGYHQSLFPGEYLQPFFNPGGRTHPRSRANFLGSVRVSLSLPQSAQGQCCISQLIVLLNIPDASVGYLLRGGFHLPALSRAAPAQYRTRRMGECFILGDGPSGGDLPVLRLGGHTDRSAQHFMK